MLTLSGVIATSRRSEGRRWWGGGDPGPGPGPGPEPLIWGPMQRYLLDEGTHVNGRILDIKHVAGNTWLAVVTTEDSTEWPYGIGFSVLRSTNNGASWTRVTTVETFAATAVSLVTDWNGNWILARDHNPLFRSIDYGISWTQTAVSPHGFRFVATDGSGTWVNIHEAAYDPVQVRVSTDNGASWSASSSSSMPRDSISLFKASRTGTYITRLAGATGYGISFYRSTDQGTTWNEIAPPNIILQPWGAMATDHNGMWMGGQVGSSLATSIDDGVTWTYSSVPGIGEISAIETNENGSWIVGDVDGNARISSDNGATWEPIEQGLNSGSPGTKIWAFASNKANRWMAGLEGGYAAVYPALEAPSVKYLTFTGNSDFTLSTANSQVNWDGILEYSTDKELWVVWDGSEIISSGRVLYLRGKGNTIITGISHSRRFVISGASSVSCDGDVMSLLDWEEPESAVMGTGCFFALFYGWTSLTKAPSLSSTTTAEMCYERMFEGCTSLVEPPELPATTMTYGAYIGMFSYCSSLISTPSLPALTLDIDCYRGMFLGCTSLRRPADLPATTLVNGCYASMFYGCENIRVSETVGGVPWRIPSVGLIEQENQPWGSWGTFMLTGTGGDFISAPNSAQPAVNTTYYLY